MNPSRTTTDPNYRWLILALLVFIGYLNQFDRQTVSVLQNTLQKHFNINETGYSLLVNAFTVCYAIAYIASGWIVDRIGPKIALTIFLSAWSIVTIGCGLANALWILVVLRAFLGLAEPGLFPVVIRTTTVWNADKSRGAFMALSTIGTAIGGITAVPIIAWLTIHYHWRLSFVIPGILGVALAFLWWKLYRDPHPSIDFNNNNRPASASRDNAPAQAPTPSHPPLPWLKLWTRRPLWALILVRLIADPVWYFCLFWMLGYLEKNKSLSLAQLGIVGWIPFFCGVFGGLAFTMLSDFCARKHGLKGRRYLVIPTALLGPLLFLVPHTGTATTIIIFCVIAILCNAWLGSIAPMISQIFPVGNVAGVYGIAGAFGATGAIVFNFLIGQAATSWGIEPLFIVMGCLHPLAALVTLTLIRNTDALPKKQA